MTPQTKDPLGGLRTAMGVGASLSPLLNAVSPGVGTAAQVALTAGATMLPTYVNYTPINPNNPQPQGKIGFYNLGGQMNSYYSGGYLPTDQRDQRLSQDTFKVGGVPGIDNNYREVEGSPAILSKDETVTKLPNGDNYVLSTILGDKNGSFAKQGEKIKKAQGNLEKQMDDPIKQKTAKILEQQHLDLVRKNELARLMWEQAGIDPAEGLKMGGKVKKAPCKSCGGKVEKYKDGGTIHIKESKKGTFTAAAKKRGKSVQGFASQVLANKDEYSSAMVKKANFAKNASKWKHAEGGPIDPATVSEQVDYTQLRKNALDIAKRAAKDKEYAKSIFQTKMDKGYYCGTRACEIERAAGYKLAQDADLGRRKYAKGELVPIIPGTHKFSSSAEKLGYKRVDKPEPGDRAILADYGDIYHTGIIDVDDKGRVWLYSDDGTGKNFRKTRYRPDSDDEIYRFIGVEESPQQQIATQPTNEPVPTTNALPEITPQVQSMRNPYLQGFEPRYKAPSQLRGIDRLVTKAKLALIGGLNKESNQEIQQAAPRFFQNGGVIENNENNMINKYQAGGALEEEPKPSWWQRYNNFVNKYTDVMSGNWGDFNTGIKPLDKYLNFTNEYIEGLETPGLNTVRTGIKPIDAYMDFAQNYNEFLSNPMGGWGQGGWRAEANAQAAAAKANPQGQVLPPSVDAVSGATAPDYQAQNQSPANVPVWGPGQTLGLYDPNKNFLGTRGSLLSTSGQPLGGQMGNLSLQVPSGAGKGASTSAGGGGRRGKATGNDYIPGTEELTFGKDDGFKGYTTKEFQDWLEKNHPGSLPKFGADGKWGNETKAAWEKYGKEFLTFTGDFGDAVSPLETLKPQPIEQSPTLPEPDSADSTNDGKTSNIEWRRYLGDIMQGVGLLGNLSNIGAVDYEQYPDMAVRQIDSTPYMERLRAIRNAQMQNTAGSAGANQARQQAAYADYLNQATNTLFQIDAKNKELATQAELYNNQAAVQNQIARMQGIAAQDAAKQALYGTVVNTGQALNEQYANEKGLAALSVAYPDISQSVFNDILEFMNSRTKTSS